MSRLDAKFSDFLYQKRTALIPFVTAGDPNPDFTVPLMHAMVEAGVDVIELGVPFSDPMADGPVIQRASERALRHHVGLRDVLSMVSDFRRDDEDTPVVLMGYLNPVECMGYPQFIAGAVRSGIDGLLTVDMPPEESESIMPLLRAASIDPIFLLAPNSDKNRIKMITSLCRGYVYYVSLKGITGASHLVLKSIDKKVAEIRGITDLPVCVGFGVKNPQTAAEIGKTADAVVVGSALISQIESNLNNPVLIKGKITSFLKSMRRAMDA